MKLELQSLRVINCGPLKDVCIDFRDSSGKVRPVIVLGGANGSGKTTILELIVGLAQELYLFLDSDEDVPAILNRTQYAQMDLLMDNQVLSTNRVFSVIHGLIPPDADLPGDYTTKTEQRPRKPNQNVGGYVAKKIGDQIEQQEELELEFLAEAHHTLPTNRSPLPSILYFPHYRVLLPISGKQIQREETKYRWVYRYETVRSFSGSLDSYLIWLDYAEPETFVRVRDFLDSLNFDGKRFAINRKALKAVVNLPDGSQHFLEELSSGEQNILILLLELRRRLLPHSIVLIDEIENSLHPAFQHRLANALLKMQEEIPFQLIVTTHAPAFLDIFGTESARILTEF